MKRNAGIGFGTMDRRVGVLRGIPVIAEYCNLSAQTVARLNRDLGMPLAKINGVYWTTPTLIDAWLLDQREKHSARRRTIDAESTIIDG